MPKAVKDLSASVRARLSQHAKEIGDDVQSVLTRYAVERFLYRLSISDHKDRFLLKGAALFSIWFDQPHRPTKDLDFLGFGSNDISAFEEIVRDICEVEFEDGLRFDPGTVRGEQIRQEEVYQGIRVRFDAFLGAARLPMQLDVGFGDAVTPDPDVVDYPTLLDFPAPHLKAYPKETVVAEKFEAMVKLGIANSRMKDLWDIGFMIDEFDFDGALLQKAIRATFRNRQTQLPTELPITLRDDFARDGSVASRWSGFIRRNRIERYKELQALIERLRSFLGPIVDAESRGQIFVKKWYAGYGWK